MNKYRANFSAPESVTDIKTTVENIVAEYSKKYPRITLGISSGLDSQILINSFASQGIEFNAAFLYMPGYNDIELNNIALLEKQWNFTANIVEIDLHKNRQGQLFLEQYQQTGMFPDYQVYRYFVSLLPKTDAFMTGPTSPVVVRRTVNSKQKFYYIDSKYLSHRLRARVASESMPALNISDDFRFITSVINNLLFDSLLNSYNYVQGNRLSKNKEIIPDTLLYHNFVRPTVYANLWGNELLYLPSVDFLGKVDWPQTTGYFQKNTVYVDYQILKKLLNKPGATITLEDNSHQVSDAPVWSPI